MITVMKRIFFIFTFIAHVIFSFSASFAEEVNVYSYRQPILINPFFEEFTKSTGIKVNVLHAKKGLLERLLSEGANTPADLVLTVDISRLKQFVEKDVLIPIKSKILFIIAIHTYISNFILTNLIFSFYTIHLSNFYP